VDTFWKTILWQQFGAAIDMLENALLACPDELWSDRSRQPEFWYVIYHTLFFLDLYLSGSVEGFTPPAPFTLEELDPAGLLPERPYTKAELHSYLEHGREKCRATIEALTDEKARRTCEFEWLDVNEAELLLYNMRHVQHHAAQLNLILRQTIDSAPRWVAKAKSTLSGE
jgi:DinB superfamily